MNKLISKIVGVALGLTLATGVGTGVILGNSNLSKTNASTSENNGVYTAEYTTNDLATTNSWTTSAGSAVTCYTSFDLDSNISISTNGSANCGSVWGSTTKDWRLYQNKSGDVVASVKDSSTYKIVSVAYTYNASNSGTLKNGSTTVSSGSIVNVNDSSITLTVGNTGTATNGQVKITKFVVVYTSVSTPSIPSISLDKELAYTHVGSNLTLTATKTNADSATVNWTSSNNSVATVSNGTVTPVAAGTTTITAKITVDSQDYSASCNVTVFGINHGLVQSDPLTIAEAIMVAKTLAADAVTTSEYYISGTVSSIKTAYSSQFGYISLNFVSGEDTFIGFQLAVTEAYANTIEAGTTVVLFKGQITNYKGNTYETSKGGSIITGTTYPEPTLVNGTLAQFFANTDGNYKQKYQVTGVISAWYDTNTNGTKYGNFYLQTVGDTSTSYYIYGATAKSSALVWNENTGVYVFTNPQDFLTNDVTTGVAVGDVVTMQLIRCDHTQNSVTTPEACGIVVSVSRTPTISIDQNDFSMAVGSGNRTLTVSTTNVENPTVTWVSDDTSVATVTDGVVSAVAAGTATITASITVNSVTYSDSVTVTVTGAATGPLENGGRYYIIATYNGIEYGLSAEASTSAAPTAVPLNSANELTAFDFTITNNNCYEITTTIENTKYYLVSNSLAASGSNNNIKVTNEPNSGLSTKSWELVALTGDDAGLYNVKENTTGSTYRYLCLYNDQDWRGYVNTSNGVPKIKFVAEGTYTNEIISGINSLTCDSTGATAPSTTAWSDLANITFISSEIATLTNTTANQSGSAAAQAMAKYDYIVGKYLKGKGLTAYSDFLNRDSAIPSSANGRFNILTLDSSNSLMIVVITAFVGVTFIGGYFFLRKKKEN